MEEGLLEKTGKPLKHWIAVIKKTPLEKHGEIVAFLKREHGFTHGFANFVAIKAREAAQGGRPDDNTLVAAQYEKKPDLKPIYDLLLKKTLALGKDIEVSPKKSSVSVRGPRRQFLLIQPSTKTRIDVGLKFNDRKPAGRLETSGPFGTMCTHRVQITDIAQVDDELMALIRDAWAESR
ncbi:MAG: DUF4287 domain-containing protein [Pseudomonadales bacterium]|nr:DUF4287 domain-containing protein [Pseudomonadales bacterium]